MKKIFVFLLLCITSMAGNAETNLTTSKGTHRVVTTKVAVRGNHLAQPIDCPDVFYNSVNSNITVDFGDQPVGNYCVTISSPFADVDYYATSPFTTIPIAVDGINDYNIIIETDDGDIFEVSLCNEVTVEKGASLSIFAPNTPVY